jgi:hypothetical protein
MKHYNVLCAVLTALPALLFSSCSDDPISGKAQPGDNAITFSTSIGTNTSKSRAANNNGSIYESFNARKIDNAEIYMITAVESDIESNPFSDSEQILAEQMSRGTVIDGDNISSYNKNGNSTQHIGLFAFAYPAETSYNNKSEYTYADVVADGGADITDYIPNGSLAIGGASGNQKFTLNPEQRYYWTSRSNKLTFYGIYPSPDEYAANGSSSDYSIDKSNNKLFINLNVDAANTEQRDVLVAHKTCAGDGSNTGYAVDLAMKHILTAVKVSLDPSLQGSYVLKECSFNGVVVKGKYDVVEDTWALDASTVGACTVSTPLTSADRTKLSSDDNTLFMMLPQSLPSGAYLEFVLADAD